MSGSLFSGQIPTRRRAPIPVSSDSLVRYQPLQSGKTVPFLVEPALQGVDLVEWAGANRASLEKRLAEHGALLFRGFDIQSAEEFSAFIQASSREQMDYVERSSPRTQVYPSIYTSTDYPPDQSIFPHNEHSYSLTFPRKIYFFCKQPAVEGGETPIVDCRRVTARISPEVKERFSKWGWMYVRNFGEGIGLAWQTVFQTESMKDVESYCRKNRISSQWKAGGRLRTALVRPTMATHPTTGERVWFNHATFFHISTLDSPLGRTLRAQYDPKDLPNNTFYGDGSEIEDDVMENLRAAYMEERVSFAWQKGDILLLDNMLVAHSRSPFKGSREVLVGMADPTKRTDL